MTLSRQDLDAGRIGLKDAIDPDGETVGPIQPGFSLRADFMEPLGISVDAVARALSVPRARMNEIVNGRRPITADTALRLSRHFGTSADFWMGLQAQYDLEVARN